MVHNVCFFTVKRQWGGQKLAHSITSRCHDFGLQSMPRRQPWLAFSSSIRKTLRFHPAGKNCYADILLYFTVSYCKLLYLSIRVGARSAME